MKRLFAVAVGSLAMMLAACGGDGTTEPSTPNPVGRWTLQTINGQALPYTWESGPGYRVEQTGGVGTINSDGTFRLEESYRVTEGTTVTTLGATTLGTWTQTNTALLFVEVPADRTWSGSISGNTITFIEGGYSLVYRR